MLRAARAATRGKVIAVVQPHRYTRLQSLFDAFASCFNDADTVIVADVYPAGEAPIDGRRTARRSWRRSTPTATATRSRCPRPTSSPRSCARSLEPGDYRRSSRRRQRSPNGPMRCRANWRAARPRPEAAASIMTSPDISGDRKALAPGLRGAPRRQRAARARHLVSRRRPGAGSVLAGRRGRPRLSSSSALPRRNSGHGHRPRLQSHRARRRRSRRRDPPWRQGVRRDRVDGRLPRDRGRGGARRRSSREAAATRASTASPSFAACPGRSAAPCA